MFEKNEYHGVHQYVSSVAIDATDAAAVKDTIYLPKVWGEGILLKKFIVVLTSNTGTITTTAAILSVNKVTKAGVSTELGTITLEEGLKAHQFVLDLNDADSQFADETDYPVVDTNADEYITIAIKTQGNGGTQAVKCMLCYAIKPYAQTPR